MLREEIEILTDIKVWESDWRLKSLLEKQPYAYFVAVTLLAKKGYEQILFFLDGYKTNIPTQTTLSCVERTSENAKISRSNKWVLTGEEVDIFLNGYRTYEHKYPERLDIPQYEWIEMMHRLSRCLSGNTLISLFRCCPAKRYNDLLKRLEYRALYFILDNILDIEIDILVRNMSRSNVVRTLSHDRIKKIATLEHPKIVELLRENLPKEHRRRSKKLKLDEMARLLGYTDFRIENNQIIVSRQHMINTYLKEVAKHISDSLAYDFLHGR